MWQRSCAIPRRSFHRTRGGDGGRLPPSNRRPGELACKFEFYRRYGVEEYYVYDPEPRHLSLAGYLRRGEDLIEIRPMDGHVEPAAGRALRDDRRGLRITRPDGRPFLPYEEVARREEQERQKAEQERQKAERERRRAEQEQQRAERAVAEAGQERLVRPTRRRPRPSRSGRRPSRNGSAPSRTAAPTGPRPRSRNSAGSCGLWGNCRRNKGAGAERGPCRAGR